MAVVFKREEELVISAKFQTRVSVVQGSLTDPRIMFRSKAAEADAFFLISDKHSLDPTQTDAETILEAVAVAYLQQRKIQELTNKGKAIDDKMFDPNLYVQILSSAHLVRCPSGIWFVY